MTTAEFLTAPCWRCGAAAALIDEEDHIRGYLYRCACGASRWRDRPYLGEDETRETA
jgi:hypothetical protein